MEVKNYQRDLPYAEWPEHQKERMRKAARKYYHLHKGQAKETNKIWREKNKEYIRDKQKEAKRTRKLEAIDYLGGVCNNCHDTFHPACFEFHHKDQSTKDRDPSKMLNLSRQRLFAELDKCVLLCANCHRLEHHQYD